MCKGALRTEELGRLQGALELEGRREASLSKHWCTGSPAHVHTSPPGFLGPSSS